MPLLPYYLEVILVPRQLLTFLPRKEAVLPQQLLPFLLAKEAVSPWQLLTFLPQEGSNSPIAGSPSQAIAILPPSEGSNSTTALPPSREGDSPPPQTGQSNNQNRSGRQGLRHSYRHRATQASQENSTFSWEDNTTTTPCTRPPKDLPMKIPTLSGSLTSPANPWHQLKGLFWLKDPTMWLPLGNLLT